MPTPDKTLGLTGCNYSTAAAAASYFNALNFTAPMVLGVANGGQVADTAAVVFSGWTGGSATNTLTITPISGQGFRSNANVLTNALRYNAANGAALFNHNATGSQYAFGDNVIVDGLQLSTDITGTNLITLGNNSVLRNSIALNNGPSAAYCLSSAGTNGTIENSILNNKGSGGGVQLQHSGWTITSSLIIATGATGTYGIRAGYPSYAPLIKNTAIFNYTTDTDSLTVAASGSTNNATDKSAFNPSSFGTAGQVSITSAEWVSLTSGSEDFRLAAGSTKLKGNGATVGPTTDIAGNTKTAPYNIGPTQYPAAGTPVSSDLAATYAVTAYVSSDLGATYSVSSSMTPVSSDLSAAFNIFAFVSKDLAATYYLGTPPGTFVTDAWINNTGTIRASAAVSYTWVGLGRIGSLTSKTLTEGTGTTSAGGVLTVSGLPSGAGFLLGAVLGSDATTDKPYYQAGTVT